MKMCVLYYSKTENTKKMAQVIADGMQSVAGVEARAFSIDAIDEAFLNESRCVVLGTPTYVASMSGAVKTWLEESAFKYQLAGKIGGAFATANYVHGGAELAIQSILNYFLVFGMLTYSGGGSFDAPIIHLGPVALGGKTAEYQDTFKIYGQRLATKTKEIFR